MKSSTLRGSFAAIALIAVAACSAAGGQNSALPGTSAGAPATKAVAADARHPRFPANPTQRAVAGEALSAVGSTLELDQVGSQNGQLVQMLGFGRSVSRKHGRSSHTVACHDGVESTWSSTGQGEFNETTEFFYDSECRHPQDLTTLDATFTQAGGNANGTQELWSETGSVVSYQTFTGSFTAGANGGIGSITIQKSTAPAPSSPPTSQSGFSCLFNTGNAVDCGSGIVVTVPSASPPEEIGFTETVVGEYVTPSPSGSPSPTPSPTAAPTKNADWQQGGGGQGGQGGGQGGGGYQCGPSGLQLTISGAGGTGNPGTLTLVPWYTPAWQINGISKGNFLTGTIFVGFGGFNHDGGGWHQGGGWQGHWGNSGGGSPGSSALSSVNLTLTDLTDGLTVVLTSGQGVGNLTGTVSETGTSQTVATMSIDYSGTGTIKYTSGAIDQVVNWSIVN